MNQSNVPGRAQNQRYCRLHAAILMIAVFLSGSALAGDFPAVIDLKALNGKNGFLLEERKPYGPSDFGRSVASAGDLNGDGIGDLVVGVPEAGPAQGGRVYVVFGHTSPYPARIDLSRLNGATGFRIVGSGTWDYLGFSVARAGDVNHDGIDDLIVGAPGTDPGGLPGAGLSFVIYGRKTGFPPVLRLSRIDGKDGFRLAGRNCDFSGISVAGAGDVNGDGIDDLVVAAPNSCRDDGSAYVVFGRDGAFPVEVKLSKLDGNDGFRLSNALADPDALGYSAAGAGDVNGDGFADIIVGDPRAEPHGERSGSTHVVFGRQSFPAILDVSQVDGTNGFRIDGVEKGGYSGMQVAGAGDVNGDSLADVTIAAPAHGLGYVVFGRSAGYPPHISLGDLDGHNGFVMSHTQLGVQSLASAGDINNDGISDVILGAPRYYAAAAFVVFGRLSPFPAQIALQELDGTNGFRMKAGDGIGWSVATAGDVNGDNVADLIVGARAFSSKGARSYVVFGKR